MPLNTYADMAELISNNETAQRDPTQMQRLLSAYGWTPEAYAAAEAPSGDPYAQNGWTRYVSDNESEGAGATPIYTNPAYPGKLMTPATGWAGTPGQLVDYDAANKAGEAAANSGLSGFMAQYGPYLAMIAAGGSIALLEAGAAASAAGADALGLAQMGEAAGLSGQGLADFVATGGTAGSTAAGGGGVGLGASGSGLVGAGGDVATGMDSLTLGQEAGYGGGVSGSGSGVAEAANPGNLSLSDLANIPTGGGMPGGGTNSYPDLLGTGGANSPGDLATGGGEIPLGGSTAASQTALGRILDGTGTAADYLQIAGGAGSTLLGYLGAQNQTDAYKDVANQYLGLGAPYRERLNASYAPGFDLANDPVYQGAFNRAADISARSWSSKAGNPAGSPTAQAGILSDVWNQSALPALSNYRGQLGQFGGLGLNTSGAASMQGAGSSGGTDDALGFGLSQLTKPANPFEDFLKQYKLSYGP